MEELRGERGRQRREWEEEGRGTLEGEEEVGWRRGRKGKSRAEWERIVETIYVWYCACICMQAI